MPEKLSRIIMAGEIIFQVHNFVALVIFTLYVSGNPDWSDAPSFLMPAAICTGRVSEIILSAAFVFGGARRLHSLRSTLWILTFIGLIISIMIFIFDKIFPPIGYIEFTSYYFLVTSLYFVLSALIPFVHLILEKQFRRSRTTAA